MGWGSSRPRSTASSRRPIEVSPDPAPKPKPKPKPKPNPKPSPNPNQGMALVEAQDAAGFAAYQV